MKTDDLQIKPATPAQSEPQVHSSAVLDGLATYLITRIVNAEWSVESSPFNSGKNQAQCVLMTLKDMKEYLIRHGYTWPSND